jgi:hypothetical protein
MRPIFLSAERPGNFRGYFSSFHRLPAIGRLGAAFKEPMIRYRPRRQRRKYIHRYS